MKRRLTQERARVRRQTALRVTLEMLRRSGPGSITLRAVATEADLPLGTLTYYFASRDELLRESLNLWVDEEVERLRELARRIAADRLAPADAAARCAEILVSYDPDQIAQYELYLAAARSPELREVAEAAFAAYDRVVADILRAAGARDPERIAPLFVAYADGLSMRRLAAPGASPPLAEALAELFTSIAESRKNE
jgi:DNA-binding transcriptional regulator YbjK